LLKISKKGLKPCAMTIIALGPFRLDTESGLLLRGTAPVALGLRAITLLRALVERPGGLVSKDALIDAAWPGQAVEENNLTVQIAALRRVLGEAAGGDGWIETMPRRGYRFVGPVGAEVQKEVTEPPPRAGAAPDLIAVRCRAAHFTRRQRAGNA
jgi:DNA-binding winged helix-turn-helix (wHTH) protein